MTDHVTILTWAFIIGFLVALAMFAVMASTAIRLASLASDLERRLEASKQAHALDVQALTLKLTAARARYRDRK